MQLAGAVETAHRAGVLHRDIKPANVLVTALGRPALSDFGIASTLSRGASGEAIGMSLPWAAPETVDGSWSGPASDVYALGATVYSLLAARAPFEAEPNDAASQAARIRTDPLPPIGRADVPESLEKVFRDRDGEVAAGAVHVRAQPREGAAEGAAASSAAGDDRSTCSTARSGAPPPIPADDTMTVRPVTTAGRGRRPPTALLPASAAGLRPAGGDGERTGDGIDRAARRPAVAARTATELRGADERAHHAPAGGRPRPCRTSGRRRRRGRRGGPASCSTSCSCVAVAGAARVLPPLLTGGAMKLKVTLNSAPALIDVVITCDAAATVEDVARAIRLADPRQPPVRARDLPRLTLAVTAPSFGHEVQLPPDKPLSEAAIGAGYRVRVAVPEPDAHGPARRRRGAPRAARARRGRGVPPPLRRQRAGPRRRGATCRLHDPLVSGRHARITIGNVAELVDLNSANGLLVDGGVVPRVVLEPGRSVLVGGSEVAIALTAPGRGTVAEVGGARPFLRRPRVVARFAGEVAGGAAGADPARPRASSPCCRSRCRS